ncbi:MAG TPA: DNA polymerase III subunit gamma/tau [Candidatus Bathyarchaeia archaeon]|nr:DNA polymerase III subunit gamma/tau [Candidatus Bathyarchaeia archaeon]
MNDAVYYLKYRPQKVSQLDLTSIREKLTQLLSSSTIPHALLFSGPKGLGKTSAARIVAKVLNCTGRKKGGFEPCNKCDICKSITSGTCLDLMEIDGASNRGIDDIRELREKIKLTPTQAAKKVYVIDEVHMLTNEAFNALLKTLEEPPQHAFFILCTTEPWKLPETIISRCQRFDFIQASSQEIVRSLKRVVKGEKLKVKDKTLDLISQKAQGSFRDATKILQQLAFSGKNISFKNAVELLDQEGNFVLEMLGLLAKRDLTQALTKLGKAVEAGIDLRDLTCSILEHLRQILLWQHGVLEEEIDDYGLTITEVKNLVAVFDRASRELRGAVIPQLPLELAIMEYGERISFPKAESSTSPSIGLSKPVYQNKDVDRNWQEVLAGLKKDNHSVEALLKSAELKAIQDDKVIIEVFYEFHKNRLESDEFLKLVEKRIAQVFSRPLKVEYTLRR